MPEDPLQQEKVQAIVPSQVKQRFLAALPWQGSQQFAIRLIFEVLPDLLDRDEVFKQYLHAELKSMYANDRANWEAKERPIVDRRQMDIPFPQELEG